MADETAFLGSEFDNAPAASALFHVIGAPLEKTTSYGKGTGQGPRAILAASQQLEAFDGTSLPGERGIHTRAMVDCSGTSQEALERIRQAVDEALDARAVPVLLGGEHTATLGALRALAARGQPFGVVHFDAHADLRDRYEGTPLSHACVMRRALDDLGLPLFQIGVRALSLEEHQLRIERKVDHLDARELWPGLGPGEILPPGFPRRIYVSFDVDVLDPSLMAATGTPEPGGLTWREAVLLLERVVAGREVVGFDVVELAPRKDLVHCDFAAARLVYDLMGMIERGRG